MVERAKWSTIGVLNGHGHDTVTELPFYDGGDLEFFFKIHCVNNKAMKYKDCSEWCCSV
jgi:hypothetical protein